MIPATEGPLRGTLPQARWCACAIIAVLSVAGTATPGALGALAWQRAALDSGQWLRLLTSHAAHLSLHHLLFNLIGLLLIAELLLERWRSVDIAALGLVSALGTSLLLWQGAPGLQWYAGLSGLLHGLWGGAALAGCLLAQGWLYVSALLALAVKLVWLNPTAVSAGDGPAMPVVAVAHLYGAVSGLVWAVLAWIGRRRHLD